MRSVLTMVLSLPDLRSPTLAWSQPTKRIIAIGDSLIYGYGDPEGGGWVERLRRQWMHPNSAGHAVYNLGVRGDGVHRVAQRLEQEFRYRGELRNQVPDVILLSVGVNDSARVGKPTGRYYTDIDTFQQQIETLLDQAGSLCPVLFIGMVPVAMEQMPFAEVLYYGHADQHHYKEITRRACQQRQIPYLDILDLWLKRGEPWWRSRLFEDGLHPNVKGYQALLEDVLAWQPFRQLI